MTTGASGSTTSFTLRLSVVTFTDTGDGAASIPGDVPILAWVGAEVEVGATAAGERGDPPPIRSLTSLLTSSLSLAGSGDLERLGFPPRVSSWEEDKHVHNIVC